MEKFLDDFAKIPQKQKLGGLVGIVVALVALHWYLIYDDQSIKLDMQTQEAKRLEADLVDEAVGQDLGAVRVRAWHHAHVDRHLPAVRAAEVALALALAVDGVALQALEAGEASAL